MKNIKVIFFDLYSTLIYTPINSWPYGRFLAAYKKHDQKFPKEIRRVFITENLPTLYDVAQRLNVPYKEKNIAKFQKIVNKEIAAIKLFDDVWYALAELRLEGYRLGLISNLATPYLSPIYKFNLDKFMDTTVLSYEAGLAKPEKKIFLLACKNLNVAPENCLMIGDSIMSDYYGAKRAGLNALLLNRENKKVRASIDQIRSLYEVLPLLT